MASSSLLLIGTSSSCLPLSWPSIVKPVRRPGDKKLRSLPNGASAVTAADIPCRLTLASLAAALVLTSASQAETIGMAGMSMRNFNPERYVGRWYEVASLKRGFSGQGQEDCHCTQGIYTFNANTRSIEVDTFCVHGSPEGYMTGIRGKVQCVSDDQLAKVESEKEQREMIIEKCFLRFPTLPFIPKQPYDVLGTDYDTYALVSGARDTSFAQVYSRTPNPGPEFIEKYKDYLGTLGYDREAIRDTPQDCESVSLEKLEQLMSSPRMQQAMTNVLPTEQPVEAVPATSFWDTVKQLVDLYFGL